MKSIIIKLLHFLARAVLKKYQPKIIAITGSVGKTRTKEVVAAVLKTKYRVGKNEKNYNTEVGLPLTILGEQKEPGRFLYRWLCVFARAIGLLLYKKHSYPQLLVLEMGADKIGDISDLLKIIEPTVGVITAIAPTHTEQFGSLAAVAREKGKLFKAIDKDGWLVVNYDDKIVQEIAAGAKARIASYAIDSLDEVMVRAVETAVSRSNQTPTGIVGMSFKLISEGSVTPVILPGIIGRHQVYPALAAAAVAQIFSIHMVAVAEALQDLLPLPGRMRILSGIKHTLIIDDTYNSSPAAAAAALAAVGELAVEGDKFAILGDMLELGALTEEEHKKIGQLVKANKFNALITVGERARHIGQGAEAAGMSAESIFSFAKAEEAALFVQQRLQEGDVILVKGSQGMRLERVVKEIMAEPEKAGELLVRQEEKWLAV